MSETMKSFLEYVAEDIVHKYGTDLSRTVVVFPNKRASLFLNESLARLCGGKPLWSPSYITISDLFRRQSTLQVADPIKLVCDLHRSFCLKTGSSESLDKFYGWGQLLITDFDDIDKNMADADRVFANLRDIHELTDLSYLTDEQRELLRRFFAHFTEEHETELKQRFLNLWSHFAEIYHDFNERLAAQGLCYEGALYRSVANTLRQSQDSDQTAASSFPADRYLFIGFNMVQKVEQRLFEYLQRERKAYFYWDFDRYYMHGHEAGHYIAQYLQHFPNELDCQAEDIYHRFAQKKQITYISAPTENIQARYVSTWLREQQRYSDGRSTAIVLCDENLLPTVIHSLPPEVEKVNITTGYPLSQTPVSSFIQLYYDMRLGGYTPRLVRAFKRHPYTKYIEADDLQGDLRDMLRQIAQKAKDDIHDPLFEESLFRGYTLVNRLYALAENGDLQVSGATMQRLVGQLMQQTSIPFHGEPIEGIQIMGVLETRNLDFDHVLLLSCNEGNMPKGVNDSSFIPHNIRHAYELTTIDHKVSIYAYYFHRLLQRAHDVTILYNNATEDGQQGEMSRFMLQMMAESPHSIERKSLLSGKTVDRWTPESIIKNSHIIGIMQEQFAQLLSPTAINRYMRCPLSFYYRYVADIKEPDIPDDEQELDNRIFGNLFHKASEIIYQQLPQQITADVLKHLLKNKIEIERAVDEAFRQEIPQSPKSGLHIINREVIIRYLHQLIEVDCQLAPFTILGLETDVQRPLSGIGNAPKLRIGGRVDRLDQLADGRIRVVDYKTGGKKLTSKIAAVDDIFDPTKVHDHTDYYLQTFVYADIVRRQQQHPVSPALLFIQHAGVSDYDPTLAFGKEKITDIADYSQRFCELLEQKIQEIFDLDSPFVPTDDLKICSTCPYALLCRR